MKSFVVINVVCDICNTNCRKNYSAEYGNISAEWGYDSNNDGDVYDLDLCESCFLKTINYLKNIAVDPNKLIPRSTLPEE